jgi:hypothetical protein
MRGVTELAKAMPGTSIYRIISIRQQPTQQFPPNGLLGGFFGALVFE